MAALVRGAFCPGCFRLLYVVTRDEGATDWVQSGAAPREDEAGHFVTCQHCHRRVPLRKSSELPGWGFDVGR
jgi:hypothetical protein